jgi:hypothetical protein
MTQQPTVFANTNTWLGCAIETVRGVPAASPDFWIPVIDPRVQPTIVEQVDQGVRGQMNATWGQVQGPTYSAFKFKCLAHADVLPAIFRSALGSPDTVSGEPPLFSHDLSLLPSGQPPSYTWFDFDGFRVRRMRGGQTDAVTLTWRADGLVEVTVRILAYPFEVVDLALDADISLIPPSAGWNCGVSLDGALTPTVTGGTLNLFRHVVSIPTLGQQVPYSLFAAPLEINGDMSFINRDDTELDWYLSNASVNLSLEFTNAYLKAYGFTLGMSVTKASLGSQERGTTGLITAILALLPLPNAADATAGGDSPIKATFRSPQAAAY